MVGRLIGLLIAAAAVLGLLAAGTRYVHNSATAKERGRWEIALDRQKKDAAAELDAANKQIQDLSARLLLEAADRQENDDANANQISDLERRLALAGRLRDPAGSTPGRGSGSPPEPSPTAGTIQAGAGNTSEAPGLLSAELDGLLRRSFAEADRINIAYISCRAENESLWSALAKVNAR